MAPREDISTAAAAPAAGALYSRSMLGTFTVTGAFALVLQIHRKQEQEQEQRHQEQSLHGNQRQNLHQDRHQQRHNLQILAPGDGAMDLQSLIAHIGLTSGGLAKSIELYGSYVARQIGLRKNSPVARSMAKLAMDYLNGDKSPSDQSVDNIVAFLSTRLKDPAASNRATVFEELVKEMDSCMISYFSFHWHHSAHLLDQVRSGQRNLRSIVLAATRKHRFQRAMQALKAKRAFTTLVETIKAMKTIKRLEKVAGEKELAEDLEEMVDGDEKNRERRRRRPVLMLVGGGMGAGKSTVVKELLHGTSGRDCCTVRHDAVVVEADAFKEADVLYRSLSSGSGDVSMASQLVHDSSTRAASSLLVSALNEGRDVVFDGTMSWEPFVMQTIAMVRDVHRRRYRLGPGYKIGENGAVVERYWEPVVPEEEKIEDQFLASLERDHGDEQQKAMEEFLGTEVSSSSSSSSSSSLPAAGLSSADERETTKLGVSAKLTRGGDERETTIDDDDGDDARPAYRILLVGVTCDALLAVVRGIRRAIITNRFVPIPAQLRSHKMFAASLEKYCEVVDDARIYSTSRMGGLPELIGVKNGDRGKLERVSEAGFETVRALALLNPDAGSVWDLYNGGRTSQVWEEVVMATDRRSRQEFLRDMLGHDEEVSDEDELSSGSSSDYSASSSSASSSPSSSIASSSIEGVPSPRDDDDCSQ